MKYILIVSLSSLFFACRQADNLIVTHKEGMVIPAFNLLLMDSSTTINTRDLPAGQPAVFFVTSPFCPYCRAETEEIIGDIKRLSKVHIYILSSFPFGTIKHYYDDFKLKNYPGITVGQDVADRFGNYYQVPAIPYIAIYGRNKILKKAFVGRVSPTEIEKLVDQ